jgi:hypothetical protein
MTLGSLQCSGRITSTANPTVRLIDHCRTYLQHSASHANKSWSMYTTASGGISGTYTRNPTVWLPYVDFSCSPVWIDRVSAPTTAGRGCLVTPRHMLLADHFGATEGGTVVFQGASGTLYERTFGPVDRTIGSDVQVAILTVALPSDVTPAKLLPTNYSTYLTSTDLTNEFPTVAINKYLQLITQQWIGYAGSPHTTYALMALEDDSPSSNYTTPMVTHDSGSANFLIINGQPVLFMENHFPDGGPAYHNHRTAIDASIATLGGGYSTTSIDLSSFAI